MSLRVTVESSKRVEKMIKDAAKRAPGRVDSILSKAAFNTQNVAITSMQLSPPTGRTYRRRSVVHTASSEGGPPRIDTGTLIANITVQKEGLMSYTVGSRKDAPHGFWLEFGTSKMAPRPWLQPAAEETRRTLIQDLKRIR